MPMAYGPWDVPHVGVGAAMHDPNGAWVPCCRCHRHQQKSFRPLLPLRKRVQRIPAVQPSPHLQHGRRRWSRYPAENAADALPPQTVAAALPPMAAALPCSIAGNPAHVDNAEVLTRESSLLPDASLDAPVGAAATRPAVVGHRQWAAPTLPGSVGCSSRPSQTGLQHSRRTLVCFALWAAGVGKALL